ncbi:MAG: HDOD domain-containing protein [Candidatus Marinimicrobia bacterium]|nr:HDOD domain-containing protein [Candidatus Neomarinimicrobiota bacterium]
MFGRTTRSVLDISKDDDSTVSDLTQVILQDPTMTARILKLVNTVFYNPQGKSISTISRAIVLLGLEAVCNICLTIKLIDTLVKKENRVRLTQEMGQSIHAAVQARNIAKERGDKEPEEIFVATLLMQIGNMAFWCSNHEATERLDKALKTSSAPPEQVEQETLGFPLRDLTKSLSKEWSLGETLKAALENDANAGVRVQNITLSNQLAKATGNGWESDEVQVLTEKIASLVGQPVETTIELLHGSTKDAAVIACSYGASNAAKIIPLPPEFKDKIELVEAITPVEPATPSCPVADPMLQLNILKEIKALNKENPTFSSLLEMVLEGIYRGTGMDHTLFALMSSDHKTLKAKYALGSQQQTFTDRFHFTLSKTNPNIFLYSMAKRETIWAKAEQQYSLAKLITSDIRKTLGEGDFLLSPLVINNKPIGIIYADRISSGREITQDVATSFDHFCAQANRGLKIISKQKR